MLNSSGEGGHPCLIPDFRGNGFSFSPLSMTLALGLLYVAFIMLRYIPSIPSFSERLLTPLGNHIYLSYSGTGLFLLVFSLGLSILSLS
jgi:hypothetical protein